MPVHKGRHNKGRPAMGTDRIRVTLRAVEALRLKAQGHQWREIGQQLGCDHAKLYKDCKALLARVECEGVEEYRAIFEAQYNALLKAHWPAATAGDVSAADFCRRVIGDMRKLMGADAPERAPVDENGNAVGGADGFDAVALLAGRIARIAAKRGEGEGAGGTDA